MKKLLAGRTVRFVVLLAFVGAAFLYWSSLQEPDVPDGFAKSNGRIEAVEIDIAAKTAGRVSDVLVDEGDFITAGQDLAQIDIAVLSAELRQAQAELKRAEIDIDTTRSLVDQRDEELNAARAIVLQRNAELDLARKQLARTDELAKKGNASQSQLDEDRAGFESAKAAVSAAQAQVAAARAAGGYARSQVVSAEAQVEALHAAIERIQAEIDDSTLKSPRDGRVQYRVAQPGEVVAAGGTVLNIVDLTDVYMTFFLPTEQAGRIALDAEARIVLDAAPEYVFPASISYVADVAQFTPKTVETADERQKLMFRIKAQVDRDLLQRFLQHVKTGLPGVAYVRLDSSVEWPKDLQTTLPQ
ncbi:HlyD family efflux transporter periplasmic adaptor subunit [Rhodospirillaceae bacterium KN72]|uniref:HlyD family efflux transporter periplasmic adaptor subunit n=2 Tax=Pacificispira spongiicola TaxID=2729598 RepID=A0A7Y0E3R6_9PROT|nr:HlyD family efflux transporter periplasmic adaptor subunit [Pacificispira spongiicola]